MPFKSEKQRKWMWSNKPEMAKKWEDESIKNESADFTGVMKKLARSMRLKTVVRYVAGKGSLSFFINDKNEAKKLEKMLQRTFKRVRLISLDKSAGDQSNFVVAADMRGIVDSKKPMNKSTLKENLVTFYNYMNDFYSGKDGIYPDKKGRILKVPDINKAISVYLKKKSNNYFQGDTVDREAVRDILIKMKKLDPDYSQKESVNEAGGVVTARIQQKPRGYWAIFNKKGESQFEGDKRFMIKILKKASTLSPNAIGSLLDRARPGGKHLEFKAQFSRYYFNESVNEAKIGRYDIGMGYKGNGLTIWNRNVEKHGDYKTIAHISPNGKITNYEKRQPKEVTNFIKKVAQSMKDKPKGESITEGGMGILNKDQTDVLHAIVMRNKNKNSNSILKIALKDRMFKGIDKRELLGYIEGAKQFVRYMKSHSMESVNESRYNVKKAIKIAKKMGGNMTGAVKKIEKIQKGLSKQIEVEDALRKANESVNEDIGIETYLGGILQGMRKARLKPKTAKQMKWGFSKSKDKIGFFIEVEQRGFDKKETFTLQLEIDRDGYLWYLSAPKDIKIGKWSDKSQLARGFKKLNMLPGFGQDAIFKRRK